MMRPSSLLLILVAPLFLSPAFAQQETAVDAISYGRDIAPLLQRNCVACHRAKQAEGGLSLETPEALLVGGDSGPLLVAKDHESSLLYARASGDEEPIMPPEDNTVGAKPFTQQELQLLKTWILQGATIDEQPVESRFDWQPIPKTIRSCFSIAVSPDNRLVAIGHANRVELADATTGEIQARLVDESLAQDGVADVDVIQSIAFSPWGDRIATGGFRTVRIWKRTPKTASVPLAFDSAVGNCAINPDRSSVAITNAVGDVEIWSLDSNEKRLAIPAAGVIKDIDWQHPESLLIGHQDGRLQICSSVDGATLAELKLDRSVRSISQSSDGRLIAVLGTDSVVQLFQDRGPKPLGSAAEIKDATSVQFLGPKTLAISTAAGVASLVEVESDQILCRIEHGSSIHALASHQASGTLATGGQDGKVKLWNISDGTLRHTLRGDSRTQLQIASLDRDLTREQARIEQLSKQTETLNKLVENETAALLKVTEAREKASKELLGKSEKRDQAAMRIADTEKEIATAEMQIQQSNRAAIQAEQIAAAQKIEIAKIAAELSPLEKQLAEAATELQAIQAKADEAMRQLAVARQSKEQVAADLERKQDALAAEQKKNVDAAARIAESKKEAAAAKVTFDAKTEALTKHRESLAAVAKEVKQKQADLAEREQAMVTATKTRDQAAANLPKHQDRIRRKTNQLGSLKFSLASLTETQNRSPSVSSIAYSDDGKRVAVVDSSGGLRTFESATAKSLERFDSAPFATATPCSHAFFVDDHHLVVCRPAHRPQVVAVDQDWTLERTIGGIDSNLISDRVTALDFRGDATSIAIGSGSPSREGQVLIVGVSGGGVLRRFGNVHSDTVLSLRFSPDDRVLATASADKTIRLLDVQSGKVIRALDGHTHHVLSLAWKQDGRLIASGSADGTLKTWDVETGQRRRSIAGFPEEVTAVEFLGDSTQVVSCCADGQIRIHETNTGGLVRAASAAGDFLFSLGITPDGKRILSGGQNGVVNTWQTENLKGAGVWK